MLPVDEMFQPLQTLFEGGVLLPQTGVFGFEILHLSVDTLNGRLPRRYRLWRRLMSPNRPAALCRPR